MDNIKEIDVIANDIVGTIVLIVEDEGSFSEDIIEFIELNYSIFVESNNLKLSMEDIKRENIDDIITMKLISQGYKVQQIERIISVNINE